MRQAMHTIENRFEEPLPATKHCHLHTAMNSQECSGCLALASRKESYIADSHYSFMLFSL